MIPIEPITTCPVCGRTDAEIDMCDGCGEIMCVYCIEDCDCQDDLELWEQGDNDD